MKTVQTLCLGGRTDGWGWDAWMRLVQQGTRKSEWRSSSRHMQGEEAAAASSSDDGMKGGGLNNWGQRVIQTG